MPWPDSLIPNSPLSKEVSVGPFSVFVAAWWTASFSFSRSSCELTGDVRRPVNSWYNFQAWLKEVAIFPNLLFLKPSQRQWFSSSQNQPPSLVAPFASLTKNLIAMLHQMVVSGEKLSWLIHCCRWRERTSWNPGSIRRWGCGDFLLGSLQVCPAEAEMAPVALSLFL